MLICPLLTGSHDKVVIQNSKPGKPHTIVLYRVQKWINRAQGSLPDLCGILNSTMLFGNLLFTVQQVSPSRSGRTLTRQICDLAFQPCICVVADLTPAARDQMESHQG